MLLYSLHNGLTLLHKYMSTRALDGSAPISIGAPLQLLGHTSAGHVVYCMVLVGCASSLDIPLASGGCPPRL